MTLLILFVKALTLVYIANSQNQIHQTNVIWGNYLRPGWAGDVTITYSPWSGNIPGQIWKVQGIVVPLSTSGRPAAPDPYNGYPTGTAYGLDKGHVIALSAGGPDISLNIVPQSAQWQRTGGWRQVEIAVYNFAMNKYGWNSVVHVSEAASIAKPNSCDVEFSVDMVIYDPSTGEPSAYEGYTTCGVDTYSFTISPPPADDTAKWVPSAPPSSSYNYNVTVTETTEVANGDTDHIGFMIIGPMSVLLLIILGL